MSTRSSKASESLELISANAGENAYLCSPRLNYTNAAYNVTSRTEPFLDYWEIMWSRKWLFFCMTLLGIIVAIGITSLTEPRYQAVAILELQNFNEDFLNIKDVSPTSSNTFQSPEFNIRTQATVLKSRPVLEKALDKMDIQDRILREKPSKFKPLLLALSYFRKSSKGSSARERALAALSEGLDVRNDPGTRIIKIIFDSADSRLAADVSNSLATSYVELNMEKRWQSSKSISLWLGRQLEDARKDLRSSEEALQSFAAEKKMTILSETNNPAEEGLRQLQSEISKAQADRIAKQSQYELANRAPEESLPEVLDDPTLREYQVQLTALRQQMAELSTVLTSENPRIAKIEAQVTSLASALQRKKESIISRIQNDYKSADRRENLLVGEYNAQLMILSKQSKSLSHYLSLKREVDSNRQLYDSLFQRVKEAEMASLLRASDINITENAFPPNAPYTPSRLLNIALGTLLGLCMGAWLAVRQAHAEIKTIQPENLSGLLGTKELGIIPSVEDESTHSRWSLRRASSYSSLSLTASPIEMIAWQKGLSPAADSYRFVLTSILMAQKNGAQLKTFSITSSIPGEGKTTVTCNLAISLAKIKNKVLLIDGDMRRPRLHSVFSIDNRVSLCDFLKEESPSKIPETKVPGLFLIPSNTNGDLQLLFSPKFQQLIRRFRDEFEMILIDCPPLLQMPDARLISRHVDAAILVIAQHTPQAAVEVATHRLMEDGTNLLGTIFNNWKFNNLRAGGYYGYAYHDIPDAH